MPQEINITDADIDYAEKLLLPSGKMFDEERRTFIRDLSTLDLQAVPGSGKTTALLAKLVILERYMPLKNGRGILVLSHTNAAVNEIKGRIGKHCPKLFAYPNFVGTIQSFVDTFLGIPFYTNHFKQKPFRIDNEIYDEQVERFYSNTRNLGLKNFLDKQIDGLAFLKSIRITTEGKLISYLNGTPETFKIKNQEAKTYKALFQFKLNLLKRGYLHFDDAYSLAEFQLKTISKYPLILQKRFLYVLVDEMQDMDIHQHNLIEAVFHPKGSTKSIIQRIGDKNQAIYNGGNVHLDNIWSTREKVLYINGSHRLSKRIAEIVKNLALTPNPIEGRNLNSDGSPIDIKPTLFLYKNDTIESVIPAFAGKIKELQSASLIPMNSNHKYMAVAWRKEHDDSEKMALSNYWPHFGKASIVQQIDFKVLEDYVLHFDKEKKTLESVRKNILNALLKILRLENITDENDRIYTKRKLLNFFKALENKTYEELNLNLYRWSIGCIRGKTSETILGIRGYIPFFLSVFQKKINSSANFINEKSDIKVDNNKKLEHTNKFDFGGINIEIGTVHSSKGQTHTATLYLETYYHQDGKGVNAKSYESQRLAEQILGNPISSTVGTRVKQSARMAYVGFSRPTHFLAIAIHKDRFDSYLSSINIQDWDIVNVNPNSD